jgi:hypothetical protein
VPSETAAGLGFAMGLALNLMRDVLFTTGAAEMPEAASTTGVTGLSTGATVGFNVFFVKFSFGGNPLLLLSISLIIKLL